MTPISTCSTARPARRTRASAPPRGLEPEPHPHDHEGRRPRSARWPGETGAAGPARARSGRGRLRAPAPRLPAGNSVSPSAATAPLTPATQDRGSARPETEDQAADGRPEARRHRLPRAPTPGGRSGVPARRQPPPRQRQAREQQERVGEVNRHEQRACHARVVRHQPEQHQRGADTRLGHHEEHRPRRRSAGRVARRDTRATSRSAGRPRPRARAPLVSRCENSTSISTLGDCGITSPLQSGQCAPHPAPDRVART